MTPALLSHADLARLVTDLVAAGTTVVAPVPAGDGSRRTEYRPVRRLEEAALGGAMQRRSLKELFLPPTEVLLRYRQERDGVRLEEIPTTCPPRVILGARPCDAAGVEILDALMGWEPRDEPWFGRREATTIVSLACPAVDSSCFCGAVGLGPDSPRGADAMLIPLGTAAREAGGAAGSAPAVEGFLHSAQPFPGASGEPLARPPRVYLARPLTPKGEALLRGRGKAPASGVALAMAEEFGTAARERLARRFAPERRAEVDRLAGWLARNFDHPVWKATSLRCHGCGACAAVCPTCHCFDIVDEHDTLQAGARRRNWDSCQTAKFTLHASGHNPRPTQAERVRQRVMHKFSVYPRRFGSILCTGCGRCARACAAGMDLGEVLERLVALAATDGAGSAP